MSELLFNRIKEIAKRKKGMSVKELGLELNIGENAIYTWKKSNPSIEKIVKVSDFLEVSADYLLGRSTYDILSNEVELTDQKLTLSFAGEALTELDKQLVLAIAKTLVDRHEPKEKKM